MNGLFPSPNSFDAASRNLSYPEKPSLPDQILDIFWCHSTYTGVIPRFSIDVNSSIPWIFPAILDILKVYYIDTPINLPKPIWFRSRFEVVQSLGKSGIKKKEITMNPATIMIFGDLLKS